MKRVWWTLPTAVLVCTGWLWSADAADPRLKKAKSAPFRNSEFRTQDGTEATPTAGLPWKMSPEEKPVEDQTESRVARRTGLMPPEQDIHNEPRKISRAPEISPDASIIDRLLAEEGVYEPSSKIQTVSAEIPDDEPVQASPSRSLRKRFKSRPKPTISADRSDVPEGIVGQDLTATQRIPADSSSDARQPFNTGSTAVGAAPDTGTRVPPHEEVPAPGVDEDTSSPIAAPEEDAVAPLDSLVPPPPANRREPVRTKQPQPRRTAVSVAPRKSVNSAKTVLRASPIPADLDSTVVVTPSQKSNAASRNAVAAPTQTTPRPVTRRVQPVAHRTPSTPTAEMGELPALQPGSLALNDAEGAAPPPPPTRVRPPVRKVTRRVQQTSISSSSPSTQIKLVPATIQTPQTQQTPSINLRWVTNGEVNVGQMCRCGLVVKNSSAIDAHNILVEAAFPKSVRIVTANPEPRLVDDNLVWKFADFPAGEERTIEITMIPFKRGELATSASVRFTGTASTVLKVEEADLAVTLKGQQDASVGETITQVITVSNPGSGVAQDVTIHAVIPKGLEHARGKRIEMTLGTLAAGESRDVRLALAAIAGGDHQLHVEARSGQHLVRRADSVVHVTAPKVTVAVQGPTLRYVGRQAQYVVTVSNVGTMATDNVRVQMQVANGFEFVKAEHGGRHDWNTRAVTWFLGRLEANQTAELPITLAARQAGPHQHTVTVTDEVGSTSSAVVETRVETTSAIVMEVVDLDDPVEVGAQTAYEIRIRNDGSKAAQDVALSFEIPPGIELVDTQGPSAARRGKGGVAFKPLPSLSPKQRATYRVIVTGREAGNLRFRAKLTSNASTEPLVVEEQTKFYAD